MADAPKGPELTMEELRARIAAAAITIPENRLNMVRKLLGEALAPLRAIDSRTIRPLEPVVTFDAAGPHVGVKTTGEDVGVSAAGPHAGVRHE